jgi:DNA-binding Lrp family transcriptional regulator
LRIRRYGSSGSSAGFFLAGIVSIMTLGGPGLSGSCSAVEALTTMPARACFRHAVTCTGRSKVVQAYILIQTEVGKAAQVAKEVAAIKGVTQAEDVTGPYDVIVRAEARNVDDLGKLVVAKIQAVEGITRTLTCPVVHL